MVKIKLKTLANKTFDMDIDADLHVANLKQQINEQFGFGEPELLKLIYTGKVLKDDQTVSQAGIKEGGFIVVMVTKKKEQAAAPAPAPAPSAAPAAAAAPAQPVGPPASAAPAPAQSSPAAPAAAPASDSGMVRGPAYEQAVENLMALGFERAQVVRAMQASFNNPDRAAEYLFSGIPDSEQAQAEAAAGSGQGSDASGAQQVQQVDLRTLQQMFQDRPELVEALINQIGAANPQLLQALGNNRAAFTQMLQDPVAFAQILQAAGIAGPMSGPDGAADMNAENVIHVTPADRQAIERLESLGFSRDRVLEAYLACDRNEEVAANYLFENGNEPDSDD